MLIFDVETAPLSDDAILTVAEPFVPPPIPGEFDPASVKTGNLKDRAKIDAKIEEARQAHAAAVANYDNDVAAAKEVWWQGIVERATLSPLMSRVVCIGYHSIKANKTTIHADVPEVELLTSFWKQYDNCRKSGRSMVGVNILNFDLPYIVRRCWQLEIDVPETAFDGRFWDRCFVDLAQRWLLGQRFGSEPASFEQLSKAFGTPGKNGHSGKDFWRLWQEDRNTAIEYLKNDVEQPAIWAARMGIMQ